MIGAVSLNSVTVWVIGFVRASCVGVEYLRLVVVGFVAVDGRWAVKEDR